MYSRQKQSSKDEGQQNIENLIKETTENNYSRLKNSAKAKYYDEIICNHLKQDKLAINYIDSSYLFECFVNGLDNIILYVFSNYEQMGIQHFSEKCSTIKGVKDKNTLYIRKDVNPLVIENFKASEEVVLKILEKCNWQIATNIKATNERGENVLHVLINKGYGNAIKYLIKVYQVSKIFFGADNNGNAPLMNAISSHRNLIGEDILVSLWRLMLATKNETLISIFEKGAKGNNNIFHLCALYKSYRLFKEIAEVIWSSDIDMSFRQKVIGALFKANPDGRLPFHLCEDEKTIMAILNKFDEKKSDFKLELANDFIGGKTNKGNNTLSIFAKKGFQDVIEKMMSIVEPEQLKHLLLQSNKDKNTPPMICVIHNRNEILKLFLTWLFSSQHCNEYEIGEFLHHKDKYGDTILSLVLKHENTFPYPQMLLLEKEKEYHTDKNEDKNQTERKNQTMLSLASCLKQNELRSAEVAIMINRVEDSYEKKSCWEKTKTLLPIFLSTLLLPIMIQGFDMGLDCLVVHSYWHEWKNTTDGDGNRNITQFLYQDDCKTNASDTLRLVPAKLEAWPRLVYSSSFIIIPWIFYLIEFCLSRYLEETKEEVSLL